MPVSKNKVRRIGALGLFAVAMCSTSNAFSADCVVNTTTTTQCALSANGDSATVEAGGAINISVTTGNTSHAIHSNVGSQVTLGSITIAGAVTTTGSGTNNGYAINLVKTSTPLSSVAGGISITGSAVTNSRGVYINDFDVAGIAVGSGGLLEAASLAIHVVDSTVISGNVTNNGTITSNGGTIYLGTAAVSPRVTGAFTNTGTIFGSGYALATDSQITGGATNESSGKIVGQINMPAVPLTNNGEFTNKSASSTSTPDSIGSPVASAVGDFTQTSNALMRIAVSGNTTAGTDFSQMIVNGDAQIDGTLHVDVKTGFNPTPGTIIPGVVIATGTLTGNFSTVTDNLGPYDFQAVVNGNAIDLVIPSSGYTIGGSVSGLDVGEFVVLQNNGADDLRIETNGNFVFSTSISDGADYDVTVLTHAVGKSCRVTNDAGTATTDVTDVTVECQTSPYVEVSGGSCFVDIPATTLSPVGSDARNAPFLPIDNKLAFAVECDPGATATIRATFGGNLPTNPDAYKLVNGIWTQIPNATFDGNALIYQITDNDGVFDQDNTPGRIEDPVSVVSLDDPQAPRTVPTLPLSALLLMCVLLAGIGYRHAAVKR